ncbi:MAG TPA: tetratricopeptide repeat protein [Rhizomicrobium sp.]|nr:tetratricopeptide repeat protein [Rhizomicrobium sp.]
MKGIGLALTLCAILPGSAWAEEPSAADEIRAGRAALVAEQPDKAQTSFEAALAHGDLSADDRFAALMGLGRAQAWLGDYSGATDAFRGALTLAQSTEDKQAATVGLARALNANEYYGKALSLLAPYSSSSLEVAVETLRAEKALGLEDLSVPMLATFPDTAGVQGAQFASLKSDIEFILANRLAGQFTYSGDSDGLTVIDYGLGATAPGTPAGDVFESLTAATHVTTIVDRVTSDTLSSIIVGTHLRIGNAQHADINLGGGSVGAWNFFEGNASWDYRIDDAYDLNASLDRSPILTTAAIADHVLFSTYSLGAGVRPADKLYFDPAVFHQDFSDGNTRNGASLRIVLSPYDIPLPSSALGAQIFARVFHSEQPSRGLYFNPEDYSQAQLDMIAVHRFGQDWTLRALAGGGYQSVDGSVAPSYDVQLSLIGKLPGNGRGELHLDRNSFASNSGGGSGYWINTVSVSVSYPFGI